MLPLVPGLVDDLADDEPVDVLSGELARVWAPFVVIGPAAQYRRVDGDEPLY
jgi:hypothetical protein